MGVIEPALGKGPRKKSLAEIREISGDWCYSGCPRTQFLRGIGVIVTIDSGVITTLQPVDFSESYVRAQASFFNAGYSCYLQNRV